MAAESTLYAMLSAHAGLAALVGSGDAARIYPDALPEDCDYPAVVFSRASTEPIATIHGAVHGAFVTLAISAWGESRSSADAVADAIESALNAGGEIPQTRASAYDPEVGLYATSLDVTLLE